jgi:hypothetical protein
MRRWSNALFQKAISLQECVLMNCASNSCANALEVIGRIPCLCRASEEFLAVVSAKSLKKVPFGQHRSKRAGDNVSKRWLREACR